MTSQPLFFVSGSETTKQEEMFSHFAGVKLKHFTQAHLKCW
jgi:hypothetical protein